MQSEKEQNNEAGLEWQRFPSSSVIVTHLDPLWLIYTT